MISENGNSANGQQSLRLKNIIFDWSGVIGNDVASAYETAMDIFRYYKVPVISLEEFRQSWEQPYMKFFNKYIPQLSLEEEQRLFTQYWESHKTFEPHEGMIELLRKLHEKGFTTIVYTSNTPAMLNEMVAQYHLDQLFQKIHYNVYDKVAFIKEVIGEHNFVASDTAIIGDTPHEVDAGKAAGITTISVSWGFKDEASLEEAQPDYIVSNVAELEKVLCI